MILRWVCRKCSKKWIYPIDRCVCCKNPVEKQKGTRLKVIGITKVNIPSVSHPIVPYNVLLLEDEFENKMPKKTMNEFKIGDGYFEEKAKTNDAVAIVKVKYDVYESVKHAIELLDNAEFGSSDKILIKPSIIAPAYPYQAVNTNPGILDALLKILFEFGAKKENIIVAEQSLGDVFESASKSGIIDVCRKNEIKFVDISNGPFEEIDGHEFKIFKEALHRKIINVPIMKTNSELGISGAVENLSRLLEENENDVFGSLAKALDVFTIADATNGMQGQGPLNGEPAFLNIVFAGRNPAFIDAVFCEAFMLPKHAALPKNIEEIEIVGDELNTLKRRIKSPAEKIAKRKELLSKVA